MAILLAWGPFLFETGAASFEELRETFGGQWAEHRIFGRRPAGQYLGPAANSIRIRGTIFPRYTGESSLAQIHGMKNAAEQGTFYSLVTGDGFVVAPFRLEKGERADTFHDDTARPQKAVYDFDFCLHQDANGPVWSLWP